MTSAENPHAGQGMVVLDIGRDIGALVVSTPASMAGLELEICPTGARHHTPDDGAGWWQGQWRSHRHPANATDRSHPGHAHQHEPSWPHVAVIGRPTIAGTEYSAVFPGLRAGEYDLWIRSDEPAAITITVRGAHVTTATWPA